MLDWCFLFLVVGFSQYFFHYKILEMGMLVDKDALPLCLIGIIGFSFFCSFLWREANIITIDTIRNIIAFKNIFTRHTDKLSFDGISGYVDTLQRTRRDNYKVLYLVQDKRYVKKISAAIYKNFDELQDGLSSVKYLGFKKLGLKERFQILFNNQLQD